MRVLYHQPLSPYSRKIRLVLSERRLPFELKLERPWEHRPEYLELNPAGTVPTLVEDDGLVVPDSQVICEYLDEAYPDTAMLGKSRQERVEVRRLVAWIDGCFARDVTENLLGQKYFKRVSGRGHPDAALLRLGYANLKSHMAYIGWLAENRKWLAGNTLSLADFALAGHFSALDYTGEIEWAASGAAKDWYARMKSRPCFRSLLADRIAGMDPPEHYVDLDF